MTNIVNKRLSLASIGFSLYVTFLAFSTYLCVYGFRKAFSAGTFSGYHIFGIDLKIFLVITQIFGYTLSKFVGIKLISEISYRRRASLIILFSIAAEFFLFLFAVLPMPYKAYFMFLNGLSLGMMWGLVFGFLEGRNNTELLGAGLCMSFIFGSGFVKSIGKYLILNWSVSDFYMPFVTGLIFILPVIILSFLLHRLPPPTPEEESLRKKRLPMTSADRIALFKKYSLGIFILTLMYMLLSAFRDIRDNFAVEIWQAVGYKNQPSIFTSTETPIAIAVPLLLSSIYLIKKNAHAVYANLIAIFLGFIFVGSSTILFQLHFLSPVFWMIMVGFGLYLAYVPFNAILFDRFIAASPLRGNSGFLIYIADSFGYLASTGVLLYKNFGQTNISWFNFFIQSGYTVSIIGSVLTLCVIGYFLRQKSLVS